MSGKKPASTSFDQKDRKSDTSRSVPSTKKRLLQTNINEFLSTNKKKKNYKSENKYCAISEEEMSQEESREKKLQRDVLASAAERRITSSQNSCSPVHSITEILNDVPVESQVCKSLSEEKKENENSSFEQEILTVASSSQSQDSCDLFPNTSSDVADYPKNLFSASKTFPQEAFLCYFNVAPNCSASLPRLQPEPFHTVLFHPWIQPGVVPRPFPEKYRDKWDCNHVRMPCSPENLYPVKTPGSGRKVQSRWELIQKTLSAPIMSSWDLEEAILNYNSQYSKRWDFRGLHTFFTEVLNYQNGAEFFSSVLPGIIDLALHLPDICTQPIPLLTKHRNHSITLSQKQIASLLANAFLCTFPRRNSQKRDSEYSTFPDINFNRLFAGVKNGVNKRGAEKLKCLINYFKRVTGKEPTGTVTFMRKYLVNAPDWENSTQKLSRFQVSSKGVIEVEGAGMLQVDFANKFVGGGVLGHGCVQEEIRFVICPELIVSRLFTERLSDTEVLVITGAEQYNEYCGYGNTFIWSGDYIDSTSSDSWGRKYTQIVAMDATHFYKPEQQYQYHFVKRELNKAYCGFYDDTVAPEHLPAIATGNWGCGAFRGDPRLKALIQLLAASEAQRDILYFTFGNEELKNDIEAMCDFLLHKEILIRQLINMLKLYSRQQQKGQLVVRLFDFIYATFSDFNTDTEEETDSQITPPKSLVNSCKPDSPDNLSKEYFLTEREPGEKRMEIPNDALSSSDTCGTSLGLTLKQLNVK
ncbi:poly(ADP-ribose) glycohydrolase-like [Limulus polyphemus]|uniref:poly(ADP-ribose) glycohydrolase n=1 Tax=Limulus polyphemus TaxID=6850 RepID=A0ABM1BFQ8_LIMPO|nr:poly(ADP-ribose) glycohydrolase-like [Limulus polyphemus]